jgi:dihydroorotate dehydrogenase (NAD+) catalytic subunit
MVELTTMIARGLPAPNPVLLASGSCGYGREMEAFLPLRELGGIVTKTVTLRPRAGNPSPRIIETQYGMLNAVGLQNVGVDAFCREKLPYLTDLGIPLLVSVMGHTVEELCAVVERVCREDGLGRGIGFELNLSCPNVAYADARMFAHDPKLVAAAVAAVRAVTDRPVAAKLSPEVPDVAAYAVAAERAGADAVTVMNTITGMLIDVRTRRPVLANVTGGLSGPAILPIAVRQVFQAARAVSIPVIGVGGIRSADDALQMIIAGAAAVQVGTASFVDPGTAIAVRDGIVDYLRHEGEHLRDLIGSISWGASGSAPPRRAETGAAAG